MTNNHPALPLGHVRTPMWVKISTGIMLVLMFAFWVVFMAGVATVHFNCRKLDDFNSDRKRILLSSDAHAARDGLVSGSRRLLSSRHLLDAQDDFCEIQAGLSWFLVAFQLICIIFAIACTLVDRANARVSRTLSVFIAMLTTLLVIEANNVNKLKYENDERLDETFNSRMRSRLERLDNGFEATLGGMVGLMVVNFVYLIFLTDNTGVMRPALRNDTEVGVHELHMASPAPVAQPVPHTPAYHEQTYAKEMAGQPRTQSP